MINEDGPCWPTHKQVGMKKKNGRLVPNCVPKNEALGPDADAGDYVKDFRKSKAPQFKGKSDKKKQKMAIAAYLSKKYGPLDDDIDEAAGHARGFDMQAAAGFQSGVKESMKLFKGI